MTSQPMDGRVHGKRSTYVAGCPCDACREGNRVAQADWSRRRLYGVEPSLVDATGTARRLQALVAAGTTQADLACHLGVLPGNLGPLVNGENPQVTARTRQAVAALYEQLWNPAHPDPRAVAHARRKGWAPPVAWDDESIDTPDARPEGVGPAGARRAFDEVAWRRALGEPLDVIARDLGLRLSSLERALARHHARAAA